MNQDRFIHRDDSSLGIEANVGIQLVAQGGEYVAQPLLHPDSDHPAPAPFLLPMIFAPLLEAKARLLRQLWRSGRWGTWALYLDCKTPHMWRFYLPPQISTPQGVQANLAYPGCEMPGPQLRLAGTFRSAPLQSPDDLAAELPPVDGLHVIYHPESWLLLSAFLMAGKVAQPVYPHQMIVDPVDSEIEFFAGRLWGLNPA